MGGKFSQNKQVTAHALSVGGDPSRWGPHQPHRSPAARVAVFITSPYREHTSFLKDHFSSQSAPKDALTSGKETRLGEGFQAEATGTGQQPRAAADSSVLPEEDLAKNQTLLPEGLTCTFVKTETPVTRYLGESQRLLIAFTTGGHATCSCHFSGEDRLQ